MTFGELVGQKLVLGIEGTKALPETVRLFEKTHAGGIILFQRNFESPGALLRLVSELESRLKRRLLVFLDHEGGRVIRFKEGATFFPDAYALGVSGDRDLARRQGEIEAGELRALGVDVNLAPVLDVLSNTWNPAIGTRSYGKDAELVARMGKARIEGMQSKGLSACAKHYPGLGEAERDPHIELPTVRRSLKQMKETHLLPFLKAFEVPVDCVMSSHVVYPEIDPKPATFSRRIIHDFLRSEFGYPGLLLTDDMIMGAVSKTVPLREAAPLAVTAGHDLLLICSDSKSQLEAFDSMVRASKKKELKTSELEESAERITSLRGRKAEAISDSRLLRRPDGPPRNDGGKEIARRIAQGAAQVLNHGKGLLPLSPAWCAKHSFTVLLPDFGKVPPECLIEPELLRPERFLKGIFSKFGASPKIETLPVDPSSAENERVKTLAQEADLVLFFCWDAHLFSSERGLLRDLQELGKRTAVVLLREPQDIEWIRPETGCVTAYGFRACQVEAAVEKLFSS